ncbi:hypothetical protein FRC09_013508 [Ceratobasidium sp. 395]|nr:hypothetical protein FRC09_013508 [Ceratobasidium sp. 395]
MALVFIFRTHWLFPNGLELHLSPGEYYHFRIPLNKALLWTHLICVIPAGLLAATQFVPRIRTQAMGFHRYAGRIINILTFVSTITGWGVAHVSFGGDLATRSAIYSLGVMTLWSVVKSWTAIRRLQIDEHRSWVIRAWSYQASVLTARLIMVLFIVYLTATGGHYYTLTCDEVGYVLKSQDLYARNYPQCQPGWSEPQVKGVPIEANVADSTGLGFTSVARLAFGPSMCIAILVHVIGTEFYLFKTKTESDRLREVSTKRQKIRQALKNKTS